VVTASCPGPTSSAWVGIFKADADSKRYLTYKYLSSDPNCRLKFAGLREHGSYEARLFPDSGYQDQFRVTFAVGETDGSKEPTTPSAASQGLSANLPQPLEPSAAPYVTDSGIVFGVKSYRTGEKIHITTDCSKFEGDAWIGLRKLSEAMHSHPQRSETGATFGQDWHYLKNYTQSVTGCEYNFSGRAVPGTYEVRVYRTLEDCACPDNLAGRLTFTVKEEATDVAAQRAAEVDVLLTKAASRSKDYDYVRAHSSDCIAMNADLTAFKNTCDFPVSVYFTRKLGHMDEAMQFEPATPSDASVAITFENRGTVGWLACHESQIVCNRALECIKRMDAADQKVAGYLIAQCSAIEK